MKRLLAICSATIFLCAAPSKATPISSVPLPGGFLDAQYTAGTGPDAAYFVVDFAGTTSSPGGSYAFGYHWDPSLTPNPTPADALLAIENASGPATKLQMLTSDFGTTVPNLFVDTFTYGTDTATPDFPDTWTLFLGTYASNQVTWGDPNDLTFGISAVDQDGNQIYSLANGNFYGFSGGFFDENFLIEAPNPRLPIAVPEPAAWILAALGVALLGIRRQRVPRAA